MSKQGHLFYCFSKQILMIHWCVFTNHSVPLARQWDAARQTGWTWIIVQFRTNCEIWYGWGWMLSAHSLWSCDWIAPKYGFIFINASCCCVGRTGHTVRDKPKWIYRFISLLYRRIYDRIVILIVPFVIPSDLLRNANPSKWLFNLPAIKWQVFAWNRMSNRSPKGPERKCH